MQPTQVLTVNVFAPGESNTTMLSSTFSSCSTATVNEPYFSFLADNKMSLVCNFQHTLSSRYWLLRCNPRGCPFQGHNLSHTHTLSSCLCLLSGWLTFFWAFQNSCRLSHTNFYFWIKVNKPFKTLEKQELHQKFKFESTNQILDVTQKKGGARCLPFH